MKTPVLEPFFNKVADLQAYSLINKKLQHRCFAVNIAEIFKNTYFEEHLTTVASVLFISISKFNYCNSFILISCRKKLSRTFCTFQTLSRR